MAVPLKEKRISTLVLVALMGILVGAYLNSIVEILPGGNNVVKTFFTYSIPFGIGDFVNNKPVLIDLNAVKFQAGFMIRFSLLSVIGIFVSLYLFRWYR
jgi:xanthosine utilization system XapX-like protein